MKRKPFTSGWQPEPSTFVEGGFPGNIEFETVNPLPVDLRYDGIKVFDQKSLNSCVAHALAAAHQIVQQRKGIDLLEPSRLFIHHNCQRLTHQVNTKAPVMISTAFNALRTFGVCPEQAWRYHVLNTGIQPPDQCYAQALQHRTVVEKPLAQKLSELTGFLHTGRPFIFGFRVYDSYESSTVKKTGRVPLPDTTREKHIDDHAVTALGYVNGQILFQNSRGDGWGDEGFGYLPIDYLLNPALAMNFTGVVDVA